MKTFEVTIIIVTEHNEVEAEDVKGVIDVVIPGILISYNYKITSIEVEETENDHD